MLKDLRILDTTSDTFTSPKYENAQGLKNLYIHLIITTDVAITLFIQTNAETKYSPTYPVITYDLSLCYNAYTVSTEYHREIKLLNLPFWNVFTFTITYASSCTFSGNAFLF